jgi:hypothetical protein
MNPSILAFLLLVDQIVFVEFWIIMQFAHVKQIIMVDLRTVDQNVL